MRPARAGTERAARATSSDVTHPTRSLTRADALRLGAGGLGLLTVGGLLAACGGDDRSDVDGADAPTTAGEARLTLAAPAELHRTSAAASSLSAAAVGDRIWLAWGEYDESTELADVFVASSEDGGRTFSPARNVTSHGGLEWPRLVATADGRLWLGVLEWAPEPTVGEFYPAWAQLFRSDDAGETWARLGRAPSPEEPQVNPTQVDLAVAPDGSQALVTWLDATPAENVPPGLPAKVEGTLSVPRFAAVSSDHGRTFGPTVAGVAASCECCGVQPFFDGDRASIAFRAVVLVDAERDERSVAIVTHEGAGAWSEPAIVRDDRFVLDHDGCPVCGPAVAMPQDGLVVTWWTGAEDRAGYWLARREGDGFGEAVRIAGAAVSDGDMAMALDPQGRPVVLAATREAMPDHAEHTTTTGEGAAPAARRLLRAFLLDGAALELSDATAELPLEYSRLYQAAPTPDGVLIAWIERDDAGNRVLARRLVTSA